jgi:type-F conjugative transfer system secretin TraK
MKKLLLPLLIAGFSSCVFAETAPAPVYKVSDTGYSMIEIENKKIAHVDVESKYATIDQYRSTSVGKVVFKPRGNEPFVMFLTDTEGTTYPVKINPEEKVDPTLIVIKTKKADETKSTTEELLNLKRVNYSLSLAESRNKTIVSLIQSIAENKLPNNVTARPANAKIYLWEEADFVRNKIYIAGNLQATHYTLKNTSDKEMVLAEKEFYTVENKVAAVAIEKPRLNPGESTSIYLVSIK